MMHDARAEPAMFYMLYWSGRARYALHVYCSGRARYVLHIYCSGRARYVFQVTVDMVATVVGRYAARFTGGDDG